MLHTIWGIPAYSMMENISGFQTAVYLENVNSSIGRSFWLSGKDSTHVIEFLLGGDTCYVKNQ